MGWYFINMKKKKINIILACLKENEHSSIELTFKYIKDYSARRTTQMLMVG